jgi:hypothetical protein
MRRSARVIATAAILLLLTSACAESLDPGGSNDELEPTRYQADVFVLDEPDREPVMCLGGIAESLPPQCEGIPIVGWNWSAVEGEETTSDTTWGFFHVVGTYDGSTLGVLEVGPPTTEAPDRDPIDTPCPEPAAGWTSPDLSKASDPDLVALMRVVEEELDFAGFWIDYVEEPAGEGLVEPGGIIANVAFTGDAEARADTIPEIWGGPLCLVRHERTYEELRRIQRELSDGAAAELGLEVTWSGVSQHDNVVELGVVVADDASRMAVDERYGAGAVLLVPALEPVEAEVLGLS